MAKLALDEELPFVAEVIKGGRLTVPEEIRKLMSIDEGDYVLIKLKVVSRGKLGGKKNGGNGGTKGSNLQHLRGRAKNNPVQNRSQRQIESVN